MLIIGYADIIAMPAYPHKIPLIIDGDTLYIHLYGDEHQAWAETEDGYSIIQNEEQQWCYAQLNRSGQLEPTRWQVKKTDRHEADFCLFINQLPKHLFVPTRKEDPQKWQQKRKVKSTIGERRVLIILMDFQDLKFSKKQKDFDNLFNQEGYSDDRAQGSVRDFFLSASYHQLSLTSDIYGPYTAAKDMAHYGKNSVTGDSRSINAYDLFTEAIGHVAEEADLSLYDGDGDGFIDNVHIIFAGYGEEAGAAANTIWSHEATFYKPYIIQGMKIDRYSCAPELRGNNGEGISRIGPHCHEIGHALGAMDYYDTNYSTNGEYDGTGQWDIMASGSWNNDGITPADFNPYVKAYNYGWITPKPLPPGKVIIEPSNSTSSDYYMLRSSEQGDYYLLENRTKSGWGNGLPGEGLLLFHIHKDLEFAENEINATAPQMCYIVCASSKNKVPGNNASTYGEVNGPGCPYPGSTDNHSFGPNSTPSAFYWTDDQCGIDLKEIFLQEDGCISLVNESKDADYTPPETNQIFGEDFEDTPLVSIMESRSRQWAIVENPENNTMLLDRPIAHGGVNCLQLSARDQYYNETCAIEFCCSKLNDTGRILLKGYYTSFGLRPRSINKLKIGYKKPETNDWFCIEVESAVIQRWQQFIMDIPSINTLEFRIEGVATIGSILALDDIEVLQEVVTDNTNISTSVSAKPSVVIVYSIDGIRRDKLKPGINLIKTSNNKIKKVFIK